MAIKKLRLSLVIFSILFLVGNGYSQTVGRIYSKTEANILFGTVIESVQMNVDQFKSIIQQTNTDVMVRVLNGELTILGDGRNVLYPAGKNVGPNEVFRLYSKSRVNELLGLSHENAFSVERRSDTTTITFGSNTLEEALPCPPYCR
jgi:hypothetical protein